MSKNPAWNAYNEAVRQANLVYEETVKPLRINVTEQIEFTEKRFDDKINPLVMEKRSLVQKLKDDYSEQVVSTERVRRETTKRAHDVLTAELAAQKLQNSVAA